MAHSQKYKGMSAMYQRSRVGQFRFGALAAILAAGLFATACSSSGSGAGAPSHSASAGSAGDVIVQTRSGAMGSYLTDGSGKSLYMFASDTSTKSACSGQCLQYWPILSGTPSAGSGVDGTKLARITTDGAAQVSYAGHPLYYYAGDKAPGDTAGQGSNNFGAKWWLLAPSGQPITTSSPGSGGSSSAAYGYGNG
jgi:predicted lipoprotein with Yx(FWY)xxD motif